MRLPLATAVLLRSYTALARSPPCPLRGAGLARSQYWRATRQPSWGSPRSYNSKYWLTNGLTRNLSILSPQYGPPSGPPPQTRSCTAPDPLRSARHSVMARQPCHMASRQRCPPCRHRRLSRSPPGTIHIPSSYGVSSRIFFRLSGFVRSRRPARSDPPEQLAAALPAARTTAPNPAGLFTSSSPSGAVFVRLFRVRALARARRLPTAIARRGPGAPLAVPPGR